MDFKALLVFLTGLKKHNTKEWFESNRATYESLRKEWLDFVGDMIIQTGKFDSDLLGQDPKKCIFRINRDIRFSNNKDPYKTNFGMSLSKTGSRDAFCGYYLHVEPGKSFVAGGVYMPMPDKLAAIRQEIDYRHKEFEKIVSGAAFKKTFGTLEGDQLVRMPKGYEETNPAAKWLKYKSFICSKPMTDKELTGPQAAKEIVNVFKSAEPLTRFLFEAYK